MNYVLYIDPLQALTTVVIAIASGLRYKKGGGACMRSGARWLELTTVVSLMAFSLGHMLLACMVTVWVMHATVLYTAQCNTELLTSERECCQCVCACCRSSLSGNMSSVPNAAYETHAVKLVNQSCRNTILSFFDCSSQAAESSYFHQKFDWNINLNI